MTTEQPTVADVRALGSFLVSAGETALLLTFQGILRSHEDYRAQAMALSTPPADDVREARTWIEDLLSGNGFGADYSAEELDAWALDLLGKVRPRGTVTDAEVVDALTAFYGEERDGWSMEKVRRMRAAITAVTFDVRPRGTATDADDVREALIDELSGTVAWLKRTQNLIDADRVMRAIAALREVRPRGTVTDTEVEAARRVLTGAADGDPWVEFEPGVVRAALEAARGVRS